MAGLPMSCKITLKTLNENKTYMSKLGVCFRLVCLSVCSCMCLCVFLRLTKYKSRLAEVPHTKIEEKKKLNKIATYVYLMNLDTPC